MGTFFVAGQFPKCYQRSRAMVRQAQLRGLEL